MVLLHGVLDIFMDRAEHLPRSLRTQVGNARAASWVQ